MTYTAEDRASLIRWWDEVLTSRQLDERAEDCDPDAKTSCEDLCMDQCVGACGVLGG